MAKRETLKVRFKRQVKKLSWNFSHRVEDEAYEHPDYHTLSERELFRLKTKIWARHLREAREERSRRTLQEKIIEETRKALLDSPAPLRDYAFLRAEIERRYFGHSLAEEYQGLVDARLETIRSKRLGNG